jgi:hypothetical protein
MFYENEKIYIIRYVSIIGIRKKIEKILSMFKNLIVW